jgi:hypothetical protein
LLLKRAAAATGCNLPVAPLLDACEEAQISSPAFLLMAYEKYASGQSPREAVAGVSAEKIDTLRLCKAVTSGNFKEVALVLKEATPDEARWIRASVCGWLRGCLLRETHPQRCGVLADCLRELASGTAPIDDGMLMFWLWGSLQRVTAKLK